MSFRIEEHIDEIADPACFPGGGELVEIVQTHVSVVCLIGDEVFKFKKAVRLPFLDFATLAARHRACNDELRLNRRLCPDIYRAVVPLRRTPAGLRVGTGTDGPTVDWAVRMKRLPAARMMDRLLAHGGVSISEIDKLARIVAGFHAQMAGVADDRVRAAGGAGPTIERVLANFVETEPMIGRCFDSALHRAVRDRVEAAVTALRRRLERRAARGRVVEGHGDLHARNVCLTDPPSIYDCLEFAFDFRCGDVATDIAFLGMDLRYRGHAGLAGRFVETYTGAAADPDVGQVLPELIRYRAMVRAKVDSIAHADRAIPADERDRLRTAARRHLRLCAWTLLEEQRPIVVVGCGPPGSGKSTTLDALADETGWPVFSTDRVRKELAGVTSTDRLPTSAYTEESKAHTYAEVIRRAAAAPGCAIIDGNFPTPRLRAEAAAAVRERGGRTVLVEFVVPDAVARQRVADRAAIGDDVSDAGVNVAARLRAGFVSLTTSEAGSGLRSDGTAAVDEQVDVVATHLLGLPGA